MADFNSKYSGEQVEALLDQVASGNAGGGGCIIVEADPVFSASPAASITTEKISSWDEKQDAISDLETIRSGSEKGATALQGSETSEELDDVETNTYVKYVAQTLTDEQKNQVRENLGIPSVDYIISLFEELKTLINNNSASDAIAVLDKAILDMHKLQ